MTYQEILKQIREDAVATQDATINCFAKTIVTMLGGTKTPHVKLAYGGFTGYLIESNSIRFKMPFSLTERKNVYAIAHECYHAFDYAGSPSKNHYSDEDRKIIENECGEYEYKYEFERKAEIFAYAFANFYMREVVGFNLPEETPYISESAKEKYPELVDIEKKMLVEYILAKEEYRPLFESYLEKLKIEFKVLSNL